METRKITLPAISWQILIECLNSGSGWATTPKDIYIAGKMDEDNIINLPPQPAKKPPIKEEWDAWNVIPIDVTLTQNQFAVCKKSIEVAVKKGIIFATKYASKLLLVFLGEPKDDE